MRKFDFEYLVDGKPMLAADQGVVLKYADLDSQDAGRDESGYLHRSVLRERVRTWGFTYGVVTGEELSYLTDLFAGKPTFLFRFRNAQGQEECCRCYCSNHSVTFQNRRTGLYQNLKFNIIEC